MRVSHNISRRVRALAGRFLESTSGNTAMIFGLVAVTVIMAGGAAIDVARAVSMKTRLSSALDAAALAVGTELDLDEDELEAKAQKFFDANYPDAALGETEAVQLNQDGDRISLSVTGHVETTLLKLININEFDMNVSNEVTRSANNIEVALVLDITGSMCLPGSGCTKIADLKVAAKDMVDMIVQDVQTPYYTKMAIVPYSSSVNVGSYATSVRGAITPGRTITTAEWLVSGYSKNITGATKANPAVITATAHGLVAGDKIWISNIGGLTTFNNKPYLVSSTGLTANSFQLKDYNNVNVNSSGYSGSYTANTGTIRKCVVNDPLNRTNGCEVRVTAAGHGFANNNQVVIKNVAGMTQINTDNISTTPARNGTWQVTGVTSNTFVLVGTMPSGTSPTYSAYTSGGTAYCTTVGCEYNRFTSGTGQTRVFPISTCVSERTGTDAYTDTAPSSVLFGKNYPAVRSGSPAGPGSDNNPCISSSITPLSTNKATLKGQIDGLVASGSTAGHIGLAWGWYMVSPTFAYLWPTASQPAAYGTDHLYKIVILMTDGEFNTMNCNGVISQDSESYPTPYWTNVNDHKNCNAPASGFTQALSLCTNMKAEGKDVIVYTVGFDIGGNTDAQNLMAQCATDTDHDYYPATGAELKQSFQHIAQEISQLRLSQ